MENTGKRKFVFHEELYTLHVYWHRVCMSEKKSRNEGQSDEKNENHGWQ